MYDKKYIYIYTIYRGSFRAIRLISYLHFIITEENIGLEEVDGLINDIHISSIDSWRRRTSKLGADRQKGNIANALFVV